MTSTNTQTNWQRIARRIRVPVGFTFTALYFWLAHPSRPIVLASLLLVLPGIWLRGYASGYLRKNSELAVTGPYAYTRNPLYLGSILIGFGFAAAACSWPMLVIIATYFALIYLPTIRSEETYLRRTFPNFDIYAAHVPRLLPRLTAARFERSQSGAFSRELYLRHREYNALMGAAGTYAVLLAKLFGLFALHH